MHVHGNQFNLDAQIYNLTAAAKADAKLAAERTRNKLLSFASALAGEYDDAVDCVVSLGEQSDQENPRQRQHRNKHDQPVNADSTANPLSAGGPFSDWA